MSLRWLQPEFLWTSQGDMVTDMALAINREGHITDIVPAPTLDDSTQIRYLPQQIVLPGFVNAHSHAFQRAMRGATEHLQPGHEADDFWSWREQMYQSALTLTPDALYTIATDLYHEMLAAGYTTVGEFHYLHHSTDGSLYHPPEHLAQVMIQAALDAGIRIVLLLVLYQTGGIGQPPSPRQHRFIVPDLASYLSMVEALMHTHSSNPKVHIGLAPHSIRAVPMATLAQLADWNRSHGLPVHMHVCEQRSEVEQAQTRLGLPPIEAIAQAGLLDDHFVGIHATHLAPDDPRRLSDSGARVCACPTTEANLGDGFLPAHTLMSAGIPIAIGSDSHIVVNPMEELRMIENNERLQRQQRNVLAGLMQPPSQPGRIAPGLLQSGTQHGADALGLATGRMEVGAMADLVALDRNDPTLKGVAVSHLPEAIVFSAGPRCVSEVWVAGQTCYAR
ncbi:MAG: formimidoylglutamate deiminase [Myxococcota bacterium]